MFETKYIKAVGHDASWGILQLSDFLSGRYTFLKKARRKQEESKKKARRKQEESKQEVKKISSPYTLAATFG